MAKQRKKTYQFWDPKAKPPSKEKDKFSPKDKKRKERPEKSFGKDKNKKAGKPALPQPVRLNRFIAQAGVCSRREADTLIESGKIKVNGKVNKELGTKVIPGKDEVVYLGKKLSSQQFVYILLNKPKNTITTMDDPFDRKTVMNLVAKATEERIYPVGRLDRNTTGLLLMTNDGKLTEKLTHPSHRVRKLYHVRLDKIVEEEDLSSLLKGIKLEDGIAKADKVDYVERGLGTEVGIEIHSGKNRIVRRMFEALGYKVLSLDRVMIAHLNKKHLPRGKWRMLTEKEVKFLMMI